MAIRTLSNQTDFPAGKDPRSVLMSCKDWMEVTRKLASLQNSYNPPEMRNMAVGEFSI